MPRGFEVYEDEGDRWRWRLRDANERIVADSGYSYEDKSAAETAIENVIEEALWTATAWVGDDRIEKALAG